AANSGDIVGRGGPLVGGGGRAGGGGPPMGFLGVARRSRRGRSLDRSGQRSRRCGADAGGGAWGGRRLCRRASCRAAVPQARARPRRSGGARAARADAERTRMSEPENSTARWSRRKREAAEDAEATKSSAAPEVAAESAHPIEDR